MAEMERFELSNSFPSYTISNRAPSTGLGDFSIQRYSKNVRSLKRSIIILNFVPFVKAYVQYFSVIIQKI